MNQQTQQTLKPHQQRVVEEKAALDEKIALLDAFFLDPIFKNLTKKEQGRLARQSAWMTGYSNVLAERIEAFGKEEEEEDASAT